MEASRVVVPDIAAKDGLEMATRDDEGEVEPLLARRTYSPLRVHVRARRADRERIISVPSEAKTSPKLAANSVSGRERGRRSGGSRRQGR